VSPARHDPAVVDNDNQVRVTHGGEPVGDDNAGPALHRRVECTLHRHFGLGVEMGGGLVQDHDRWCFEEQASNGQSLPLTTGQSIAPLADDGVQTVRQPGDQIADLRRFDSFQHLLLGEVRTCVGEVGPDGVVEHVGVLGDIADRTAQRCQLEVANVGSSHAHRAVRDVVQPSH
jgi:hypothetical protein